MARCVRDAVDGAVELPGAKASDKCYIGDT
jgi:hypothetical protein